MKPKVNEAMFRKVIQAIEDEPGRLFMGDWVMVMSEEGEDDGDGFCGTTACIAGHACVIDFMKEHQVGWSNACRAMELTEPFKGKLICIDYEEEGADLLGIDDNQADVLFFVEHWPEPFRTQYKAVDGSPNSAGDTAHCRAIKRSQIAVRRIKHFLKTGE